MANQHQPFRQHQIMRALKAAKAAGMDSPSVKVRLPSGVEFHIGGGEVGAPKPKKESAPKSAPFARGGDTAMHGKGDRTVTASPDSAGKQAPGRTGHSTADRGGKLAEGGGDKMFKKQTAAPAKAGSTAVGGEARPARPGSCGT